MNFLNKWQSRKFYSSAALLYILFFVLLMMTQRNKLPDVPVVLMQLAGAGMIVFFSLLYDKHSFSKTLVIIVAFQLACFFGLRFFNIEFFENPLGYDPQDALSYHQRGSHIEMSLLRFIRYLNDNSVNLDDFGFNIIVHTAYSLTGNPETGMQLLVLFNVIAVSVSSYFVYKLSSMFFEKGHSIFVTFFWATELYAVYTASVGLKENFMVMFIVIAIYYIIKVHKNLLAKDIILAVLFSLPILLFRTAVFYMLICTLLYIIGLKLPLVKRYIYFFIAIIMVFAIIYGYQTIDELALSQGYSYDVLQDFADKKVRDNGTMTYLLNYFAAVFGPFPNLVAEELIKKNYITLYSFSSFCKVFYSFFMVYGIFRAFRNKHFEMMGIALFWFLNTFMLLFTLFAQHDRYQWPHMPFTIVLACYGFICWQENTHMLKWDKLYMLFAILMILVFNYR